MKTSVSKMMMSLALMGCLIIGASDASAQSRSRSQGGSSSSRSQSAAVSRPDKSTAPTVNRTSSSSSSRVTATPQVSRTTTTPQVSRNTTTPQVSRNTTTPQVSRTTTTPQVSRTTAPSSSSSTGRTTVPSSVSRSDHSRQATVGSSTTTRPNSSIRTGSGATTRGGSGNGNSVKDGNHISTDKVTRPSESVTRQTATSAHISSTPGGATTRPTSPGTGNDKRDKKPGNGGKPGNSGKPHDGDKPGQGGHQGYDNKHRYDYDNHHYRDEFKWNYTHHNWGRPLPPPARPHRPAPWVWYRPTIPAGWHPYAGAPIIDRILGLVFGSLYEASLDHLYYSGYYIDGYADGIIYLRDVPMLNLYWPDVMLNYEYNRLVNAQFVYHSSYYDMSRYNRVYRSLSRIYGTPVYRDGMTISWYGGNSQGYVTLSMVNNYGDYYTTLSIGY